MGGLFSKPKAPSPPKLPPPVAIPQADTGAEDNAARMAKRRSGFQKTILTGALEPGNSGKKQLLGG